MGMQTLNILQKKINFVHRNLSFDCFNELNRDLSCLNLEMSKIVKKNI